ncbi:TM0106 family RecB-like putative nuclease [Williamsia maris]|uniref:RecB family nuclease, putative, TM0106 family n=2 Tax=Williamsia maris TaxID=72806 RepID=A0ABT1HE49_9NOCA|nr:RecB family nuclease, putative, TM0106 family [Williamsia maris]
MVVIDELHPTMTLPLLTARDLAGCEHRLALDHLNAREVVDASDDPSVTRRKEAAAVHRAAVAQVLAGIHTDEPGTFVEVASGPISERVAATLSACAAGAGWVFNAALPTDRRAGRRGGSELLARVGDGYVPVIVVNHRVSVPGGEGTIRTSPLFTWLPADDPTRSMRSHRRDVLRLAHLTRLLEHAGLATDTGLGGSIGLDADCIVVHDLTPAMPGYDETLARRHAIAAGALSTVPSRIGECRTCPWWVRCGPELVAARDVSLVINGNQARVARDAGLLTVDDLADYTGPAPDDWSGGDIADAVVLARAWRRGVSLVRRVEVPTVARADVEVDVDMESYGEDGAYLWGTLLTDRTDPTRPVRYRPFVTWDPLPTVDEGRSFAEFWAWLTAEREAAAATGKTFAAYCYSQSAENRWLLGSATRFAGLPGVPTLEEVKAFIASPQWVDVYEAVGANFICPQGKGLKKIAPVAGFGWRDPEAGGEASMEWYRVAVGVADGTPDAGQRDRILAYNEDDVWATKVLREWITDGAAEQIVHRDDL